MDLKNSAGERVEIEVMGYQFPESRDAEYDSNWLRIHGAVNLERGAWCFESPCLLTYEVEDLANWLEALSRGDREVKSKEYIEPVLVFRLCGESRLRIYFELESRPKWAPGGDDDVEELFLDVEIEPLALRRAAKSLRRQLARYPERTKV